LCRPGSLLESSPCCPLALLLLFELKHTFEKTNGLLVGLCAAAMLLNGYCLYPACTTNVFPRP
jgi:hypothetical protein